MGRIEGGPRGGSTAQPTRLGCRQDSYSSQEKTAWEEEGSSYNWIFGSVCDSLSVGMVGGKDRKLGGRERFSIWIPFTRVNNVPCSASRAARCDTADMTGAIVVVRARLLEGLALCGVVAAKRNVALFL
jgi:hypothetical protein